MQVRLPAGSCCYPHRSLSLLNVARKSLFAGGGGDAFSDDPWVAQARELVKAAHLRKQRMLVCATSTDSALPDAFVGRPAPV